MIEQEFKKEKARSENAVAMVEEILNCSSAIAEAVVTIPKRRKYWTARIWYWRSDRKKRKAANAFVVTTTLLSVSRLMVIIATPIPKFESGSANHAKEFKQAEAGVPKGNASGSI